MRVTISTAIALLLVSAGAHAESMRCGSSVVDETTSVSELLAKCGEPQSKETRTEDLLARTALGGTHKVGTVTIERWIYQRSNRALPMAVTIVDGKVTRLERAD